MNKKELVSRIVEVLQENDIRKKISAQKAVFHISDDFGHKSDFVVRKAERGLLFNSNDVDAIIDACLAVIEETLKKGEEITVNGYGSIGLNYREARQTKHPATGECVTIAAKYTPKAKFGKLLKRAAKVYELSLADQVTEEIPRFEEDGDL